MVSTTVASKKGLLAEAVSKYSQNKRLTAPLAGFPGCDITSYSIKVAQQNGQAHYECIRAIYDEICPDISFAMMDLSVEANALGMPVRFPANESASVESHLIKGPEDLDALRKIDITSDSRVRGNLQAVELISGKIDNLCCAYVAGPITLAGLMCGAEKVAMDAALEPEKFALIAEFATDVITKYALALCDAGADAICILEPTGMIFGPNDFDKFSGQYVRRITEQCRNKGVEVIYHICGNCMHLIEKMCDTGVAALSLDSPDTGMDLPQVAQRAGSDIVIIGNVNPVAIMKDATPEEVFEVSAKLVADMSQFPNFILSTGCDLPPGTPLENIKAFMKAASF